VTIGSVGIAGSGAIALGLAQTAESKLGPPLLWARSTESAVRARREVGPHVHVTTGVRELAGCEVVVEAVVEDEQIKSRLLADLNEVLSPATVLMTTTSSLSIERLAAASGRADRFVGLHVFTPVTRMLLIEVVFPAAAKPRTRAIALEFATALDKTPMVVPDIPGFIVNRLIFPFLFDAVRLLDVGGVTEETIDGCVRLGAAHPMGPLALLDFVGLDIAAAIGEQLGEEVPVRITELIEQGRLGRKTGGIYDYA
jgi:3-hydroxyacyl-CoA dehydrogenase